MDFGTAIKTVYNKYATFSGRAPRSEFWWYMLFYIGLGVVLDLFSEVAGNIWTLGNFLPSLAVGARRLHDIEKSGWFQILPLAGLPIVLLGLGADFNTALMVIGGVIMGGLYILVIVWWATAGTQGPNRYGEDPFQNTDADVFT
jgi:uncharacterized membrane protein YhaH (DUF805 family)